MPAAFSDLAEKEKVLYVSGVMDGEAFMLYGASNPDLDPIVNCVKAEGIKNLIEATETVLALNVEELQHPMPWAISRGLGLMCRKYRDSADEGGSQ